MAFIDGGVSEAYVSPQIEQVLGFSREEWLDDPIRWYQQIHPDDRSRWSIEAAEMFVTGKPLKSVYRVRPGWPGGLVSLRGKLVRRKDGQPWFIHGVGFDVTDLKQTEQALHQEIAERDACRSLSWSAKLPKQNKANPGWQLSWNHQKTRSSAKTWRE